MNYFLDYSKLKRFNPDKENKIDFKELTGNYYSSEEHVFFVFNIKIQKDKIIFDLDIATILTFTDIEYNLSELEIKEQKINFDNFLFYLETIEELHEDELIDNIF